MRTVHLAHGNPSIGQSLHYSQNGVWRGSLRQLSEIVYLGGEDQDGLQLLQPIMMLNLSRSAPAGVVGATSSSTSYTRRAGIALDYGRVPAC